jgi:eukaryotic-like serine/threonine-protein kinase
MRGLLEQAVKIKPQDALVQSRLASLYAHQKLRDKALTRIQTALALAPDDPYVLANVGSAYEDIGDRRKALEYIRRALQKGYALDQVKNDPDLQGLIADPNFQTNGK